MSIIEKIHINYFRNLSDQNLVFSPHINLFIGANGVGKTNFIESIYYLGRNKSFKTRYFNEVVCFNKPWFSLVALINKKRLVLHKSNQKSRINIDGKTIKNTSELTKLLPIKLISPDKGFIVGGTPKNKRYYLDWGVFHTNQKILLAIKSHQKILKHINKLLLPQHVNKKELALWFKSLAEQSAKINTYRSYYLEQLKIILMQNQKNLLQKFSFIEDFNFFLTSGFPSEICASQSENIYDFLVHNQHRFIKKRNLDYGAHKASIHFELKHTPDKLLSRGEQKTLSFIFWFGQILWLKKHQNPPLLLIDDLYSELDSERINTILSILLKLNIQVFITAINTQKNLTINKKFIKIFHLENGKITT